MKKFIFLFYAACIALPLFAQVKSREPIQQTETTPIWDEGNQELTIIRYGIPYNGATSIVYRRDGKPILDVELQTPVVVAVASKPMEWGHFQFPRIYRSAGGLLVAKWQMAEDDVSAYGKLNEGFRLSSDNGKTWNISDQPAPFGEGLLIPSTGEHIAIATPVPLDINELQLPKPISTMMSYHRHFNIYRLSELPEVLQGVYLDRWDKNGVVSRIHAGLEDPGAARHSDDSLFPVVWWGDMKLLPNNTIVAGIYPMWYERETGGADLSGVSFYQSIDGGMNWKIKGKIPYRYDLTVDPNGNRRDALGFTEPGFEILSDGTFLCVLRTDGPMYISRSSDQGITWSHAVPLTPNGVLPRLLQLDNGVLVLSSGRPGVQIRFSIDGKGEKWTDPFEMLPFNSPGDHFTCAYTQLLAIAPDRFLVIYSDFYYPDPVSGELRKAIMVREIKVTKK